MGIANEAREAVSLESLEYSSAILETIPKGSIFLSFHWTAAQSPELVHYHSHSTLGLLH